MNMPTICYVPKTFTEAHGAIITQANEIIDKYERQGFSLTLRQLYYQFVVTDAFPEDRRWKWTGSRWVKAPDGTKNATPNYKWFGLLVADARNAGKIDWNAIEDRTRGIRGNPHWDSPAEILESCAADFRYDLWEDQDHRIEVWIEKDALIGVFEPVCQELDVPVFSCRGYTSQSEAWVAGRRLRTWLAHGQTPVILHFGDHDPSGIDMTRDIIDRLELYGGSPIKVERVALNRDQVDEYGSPPNPAKTTDSRYAKYVEVHGEDSWELDGLEPTVLARLVKETVEQYRDADAWNDALSRQQAARDRLSELAHEWRNNS